MMTRKLLESIQKSIVPTKRLIENSDHESISLNPGEYLIKVFVRDDPYAPDFHFVRYDPTIDIWFHKEGYYSEPWIVPIDSHNAMFSPFGKEPKNYRDGTYQPCSYYVIAEPN